MTGDELLTRIRTRQASDLRACFPTLSERDLMQVLCANHQQAAFILQQCFSGSVEDAKAAWNDFVLRYIDGRDASSTRQLEGDSRPQPPRTHLL